MHDVCQSSVLQAYSWYFPWEIPCHNSQGYRTAFWEFSLQVYISQILSIQSVPKYIYAPHTQYNMYQILKQHYQCVEPGTVSKNLIIIRLSMWLPYIKYMHTMNQMQTWIRNTMGHIQRVTHDLHLLELSLAQTPPSPHYCRSCVDTIIVHIYYSTIGLVLLVSSGLSEIHQDM